MTAHQRSFQSIYQAELQTGRFFVKLHGLGNDFIVVDGRQDAFTPEKAIIQHLCDRHIGIGGDQLLVIEPPSNPDADFRLRIYNIDGLEAPSCFNATRCAAWLIMEEAGRDQIVVETAGGHIHASLAGERRVSMIIDTISDNWQKIPLANSLEQAGTLLENGPLRSPLAFSMGNPHLVYFVDDLLSLDVITLADPIQKSPFLPEQANIGVGQIITDGLMKLVVYERPGILTRACGSGACAAVLAAHRKGLMQKRDVKVEMPGGSLEVRILEKNKVQLTGNVALAFYGSFPDTDSVAERNWGN